MSAKRYEPIDLSGLRTYSVQQRQHKFDLDQQAKLPPAGASAADLLGSLPPMLGAGHFRAVVEAVCRAVQADLPVVWASGAHVIKVGCSPIVIDLIDRGIIRAVVGNGAVAIHDVEVALLGQTSEEVADTIRDGTFGMVEQTLDFFTWAIDLAGDQGIGLGQAVGRLLVETKPPHLDRSILARAYQRGIPACIQVAVGTDTIHVAPKLDGAKLGAASLHDFRLLCSVVADMGADDTGKADMSAGGVWLNVGSAVVLPEVFLKAVSVARNLGANLDNVVTANFDMIGHYRPHQNVISRPVRPGQGHQVLGHHEILLPLLRQAIIERLAKLGVSS